MRIALDPAFRQGRVSGPIGRQRVHFEAPPADRLEAETSRLLHWVNGASNEPPLLKAGLGHLWFVTLHPFDDGNGRIARAIGDLLLARADGSPQRFYSLSAQIQHERKAYYDILERTQKRSMDVTEWLARFLDTLHRAVDQAQHTLDAVLTKTRFWQRWATTPLNERQVKLLNRLFDGFEGKLTSSKWAAIAKCLPDTALRDINDLLARGVLRKSDAGGRSTSYELNDLSALVFGRRLGSPAGDQARSDLDEAKISVAMTRLDAIWDQLFPAEQTRIVKLLVEKVIVSPNDLEVRLRVNGIERLVLELRPKPVDQPGEALA